MTRSQTEDFISPTPIIESNHPAVADFVSDHAPEGTDRERAVRLYYAVRDGIRYDAYKIDLTESGMKASFTLEAKYGWCVSKAVLLAACCRSIGISSRLGFADVRNHLSTARLRAKMGTDLFYWHGYTEIQLDGKWVKATPAFNIELCNKFNLLPLEFDGQKDSLYHPFDAEGNRHMEYVNDRGVYSDVPLDQIIKTFQERYSFLGEEKSELASADFDRDVAAETRS